MNPNKVLMCRPSYFEVNYEGNEFMKGNLNAIDKDKAIEQWEALRDIYKNLGYPVIEIDPVPGLVDMVFTANQSLPWIDTDGKKKVILSRMRNKQRRDEVEHFRAFYVNQGYEIIELPEDLYFESMGDALLDYSRNILFGGYGYRSDKQVYNIIANYINLKIVQLKLINQILYHLDTCLSILNKETVVVDVTGFNADGLQNIRKYFPNVIEADPEENLNYFVCNCHCPDGKNVIVQKGSVKFKKDIEKAGFNLIETDTSEFMKSGGSVFCMKMMIY